MKFLILGLGEKLPGHRLKAWNISGWSSYLPAGGELKSLRAAEEAMEMAMEQAKRRPRVDPASVAVFAIPDWEHRPSPYPLNPKAMEAYLESLSSRLSMPY